MPLQQDESINPGTTELCVSVFQNIVFLGMCMLVHCVCVGVLSIYCLRVYISEVISAFIGVNEESQFSDVVFCCDVFG